MQPPLRGESGRAQLDRWARSFPNAAGAAAGPAKPILVVVTASGGALRAAIWTETVLGSLDQTFDDFHHHVRLITGASGGMLGGARYVSGHAEANGGAWAPGRAAARARLPDADRLADRLPRRLPQLAPPLGHL